MKNNISLEIGDAACGIDCIILYDNDDRLIKSISSKNARGIENAINQHDKLVEQNKQLKEEIKKLRFMIENGLGYEDMVRDI